MTNGSRLTAHGSRLTAHGSRQNYLPDIPIFQSANAMKLVLFTQQTHILPLDLHAVNGLQDPLVGDGVRGAEVLGKEADAQLL